MKNKIKNENIIFILFAICVFLCVGIVYLKIELVSISNRLNKQIELNNIKIEKISEALDIEYKQSDFFYNVYDDAYVYDFYKYKTCVSKKIQRIFDYLEVEEYVEFQKPGRIYLDKKYKGVEYEK